MHPGRPKRLSSFSYRGCYRYSLTFCAAHQHPAFVSTDIVQMLVPQILRTCEEQHFELLAYCFMPDHVHLLLEGLTDDADFRACGRVLRQRTALAYAQQVGRRLWQPGYWEKVLREEDGTEQCARYIFGNPVRRGLVRAPREYPYSGGTWFQKVCRG
jgi:putative transposase